MKPINWNYFLKRERARRGPEIRKQVDELIKLGAEVRGQAAHGAEGLSTIEAVKPFNPDRPRRTSVINRNERESTQ